MVSTGETVMTFYGKNEFLSQSLSIWRSSDHPSPSDTIVQYPFSFTIPSDHSLPPSHAFQSSSHQAKGSVQYHVKVTGKKAAWYKSNVRLYGPFPFLPFDDNGYGRGKGEMKSVQTRVVREEMSMRNGLLFGGHAKVLVEVRLAFPHRITSNSHRTGLPPRPSLPPPLHTHPSKHPHRRTLQAPPPLILLQPIIIHIPPPPNIPLRHRIHPPPKDIRQRQGKY